MASSHDRDLDVVVFGATSFVGQLTVAHLGRRTDPDVDGSDPSLRWGVAARDAQKLGGVLDDLGLADRGLPTIIADATDRDALDTLAARTKVLVSTVGPYARFGSDVVAAVAAAGTDYCDLTGEPQWIHRMIDAHHDTAIGSGSRIVHCCGFDSIPSDLGVVFLQAESVERFGEPCSEVAMRLVNASGGASGGTIASGMNMVEEAANDRKIREILADPYALVPPGAGPQIPQPEVTIARRDDAGPGWIAPFVMATINTKIVHRTHALLGRPWGDGFRYGEAMATGSGPLGAAKAVGIGGATGGFMMASALSPVRKVVDRFLPDPGTGPTPEQQEKGFFVVRLHGRTESGDTITAEVTGDRDPGYGSTAKMLAESAWALAEGPGGEATVDAGVLTPGSALGVDHVARLVEHAGLTFDVVDA